MQNVAGLLVLKRNKVLLVFKGGYWFFPGGKQETGESLEEAISRELEEELCIGIRKCPKLIHEGEFDAPRGECFRFNTFMCEPGDLVGTPRLNPHDSVKQWAWVDLPLELNLTKHARFILKRFAQHKWAA